MTANVVIKGPCSLRLKHCPCSSCMIHEKWNTLNSKRNYTLCFWVGTQYVVGLGPQTGFLTPWFGSWVYKVKLKHDLAPPLHLHPKTKCIVFFSDLSVKCYSVLLLPVYSQNWNDTLGDTLNYFCLMRSKHSWADFEPLWPWSFCSPFLFVVLIQTHDRLRALRSCIKDLKGLLHLDKVVVIWNNPTEPPTDTTWPDIDVPLLVSLPKKKKR